MTAFWWAKGSIPRSIAVCPECGGELNLYVNEKTEMGLSCDEQEGGVPHNLEPGWSQALDSAWEWVEKEVVGKGDNNAHE